MVVFVHPVCGLWRTFFAAPSDGYRQSLKPLPRRQIAQMHLSTSAGIEKPEYFEGRNQSDEPKDVLNGEAPVRQFAYSRQPRSAGNYAPRTMAD
jgi:hypothetical protein